MKFNLSMLVALLGMPSFALANFPEFLDASKSDGTQPVAIFIPGEVFGSGTKDFAVPLASAESPNISYPLFVLEQVSKNDAATQTSKSLDSGLTVMPSETKLVRIGTYTRTNKGRVISGNFYDSEAGRLMILVYVDQPCRMEGEVKGKDRSFIFDVELDRAGFHWILEANAGLLTGAPDSISVRYGLDPSPRGVN